MHSRLTYAFGIYKLSIFASYEIFLSKQADRVAYNVANVPILIISLVYVMGII